MASLYEAYERAGVYNRSLSRHEREKRMARVRARLGLGPVREKLWRDVASRHKAISGRALSSITPRHAPVDYRTLKPKSNGLMPNRDWKARG